MKHVVPLVLADDHTMFRAGLRRLLEEKHYAVVGEASTGREAIEAVRQTHPEILLIDFSMPELNGLDAMTQALREAPRTRVILLSMHHHESYVLQALHRGAVGYVVKDSAFQDLVAALQAVQDGKVYVSPAARTGTVQTYLADHALPHATSTATAPLPAEHLTPREQQLLRLIADGKSTKEIAAELGIGVKTADTHRAHLMRKLNVHKVAELLHAAIQRGLLQL